MGRTSHNKVIVFAKEGYSFKPGDYVDSESLSIYTGYFNRRNFKLKQKRNFKYSIILITIILLFKHSFGIN